MAAEQFGGQIQQPLPRPVFAVQQSHAGGEVRAVNQARRGVVPRPINFATHIAGGDLHRAIAADGAPVTAYLFKGGLLNRLQRYDEALKCYEQAMIARDKKKL